MKSVWGSVWESVTESVWESEWESEWERDERKRDNTMIIESETKPVIIRNQSLNGKLFIIIFEKFENSLLLRVE